METYKIDAQGIPTIRKAANAHLDYSFDWTAWLAALSDSITAFELVVPSGITLQSSLRVGGVVTAWMEGGKPGATYPVRCRITTAGGREDERTIMVMVLSVR